MEEIRQLGSGTYGAVYHGKWKEVEGFVAIKSIKASCFAGKSSERERLVWILFSLFFHGHIRTVKLFSPKLDAKPLCTLLIGCTLHLLSYNGFHLLIAKNEWLVLVADEALELENCL